MAKRASDADQHDGPMTKQSVQLDAGLLLFLRTLGGGDVARGVRRAGRLALASLYDAGKLERPVLERMERTHPERAKAYYDKHPDQILTPYHEAAQKPATWRDNEHALRTLRRDTEEALRSSPLFPLPTERDGE